MAVDTRDKRFSMLSMARPFVPTLPNPDGAFSTARDRAQLAWMYGGLFAGASTFVEGGFGVLSDARNYAVVSAARNSIVDSPVRVVTVAGEPRNYAVVSPPRNYEVIEGES